jgi:hypothetical protein
MRQILVEKSIRLSNKKAFPLPQEKNLVKEKTS